MKVSQISQQPWHSGFSTLCHSGWAPGCEGWFCWVFKFFSSASLKHTDLPYAHPTVLFSFFYYWSLASALCTGMLGLEFSSISRGSVQEGWIIPSPRCCTWPSVWEATWGTNGLSWLPDWMCSPSCQGGHSHHSAATLVTSGPVRKQRAKNVGTQLLFFFVFNPGLQPLQWCYWHLTNRDAPSWMPPKAFSWGDFRSCKVDTINHHKSTSCQLDLTSKHTTFKL